MNIGSSVNINYTHSKAEGVNNNNSQSFQNAVKRPSFGADESKGLSANQAAALRAQRLNQKTAIPHMTEKDVNFAVTLCGMQEIKGNHRSVYDYRCGMQIVYGYNWYSNFTKPHLVKNQNADEKRNGPTTALVIPLKPYITGLRGADNATILLNGDIPKSTMNELINYLGEIGVLNKGPISKTTYFINSDNPKEFMSNPKIKTAIVNFLNKKRAEQISTTQTTPKVEEQPKSKESDKVKTSDINIANIGFIQDKNNSREVKDYLRYFMNNERKFTVLHDTFGHQQKDMTIILIPSKKSEWDCITVTIDGKKLSYEEAKNLINHLAKNKIANTENPNFRSSAAEYLNKQ